MNGGQVLVALCCIGFVLGVYLAFEVAIFRVACALCKAPQPGLLGTVGIVFTQIIVPAILDAVIGAVLIRVYTATNYPLWEAGVVQFFLALPIHMGICSVIHAKAMSIPVGQGLAVWLVEKLIKLSMLVLVVGAVALVVLVARGN